MFLSLLPQSGVHTTVPPSPSCYTVSLQLKPVRFSFELDFRGTSVEQEAEGPISTTIMSSWLFRALGSFLTNILIVSLLIKQVPLILLPESRWVRIFQIYKVKYLCSVDEQSSVTEGKVSYANIKFLRKDKWRASKEMFFLLEEACKMKASIRFLLMAIKLLLRMSGGLANVTVTK